MAGPTPERLLRGKEGVSRMGRFAASGDSLELHIQFVNTVVDRYRQLVQLCEQKAISWRGWSDSDEGGGTFSGGPIASMGRCRSRIQAWLPLRAGQWRC